MLLGDGAHEGANKRDSGGERWEEGRTEKAGVADDGDVVGDDEEGPDHAAVHRPTRPGFRRHQSPRVSSISTAPAGRHMEMRGIGWGRVQTCALVCPFGMPNSNLGLSNDLNLRSSAWKSD